MNRRYHKIFQQIGDMLWESVESPAYEVRLREKGEGTLLESKSRMVERDAENAKKIITAYIDQQAEMMKSLILDARFSRFPMPRKRIRIWTRIRARLEWHRAIRQWRGDEPQDF